MESVLIADDEENIREGIKLIIDWEELGFEIVGTASNGEEALSSIIKTNPSLVVMDMQMPKIHGIDVIRKAREQGYEGYFIILSGYSDFSYAREAIRNRVTNYITKPVDEDELLTPVRNIKGQIEAKKKAGIQKGKMQSKARSVVIRELLLGTYGEASGSSMRKAEISDEQLEELREMHLLHTLYQVIIHETYRVGKSADNSSKYDLTELLPTFLDSENYELCNIDSRQCILLKGMAAISRFEEFIGHYEKAPIESDSPLDYFFIAIGEKVDSPADISCSYDSAASIAKRRFFCEEGEHFIRAKLKDSESDDSSFSEELSGSEQERITERLIETIIAGSRKDMTDTIETLNGIIKRTDRDISDICLYLTDIYLSIKDRLVRQYPMLADHFDSHARIIEFIESRFYLYEIMQYITESLEKVMDTIHDRTSSENIIEDILSYTDRNYAQPLTLEDLAAKFGYNSGYLGRLFTRTTGTGYNYYLNEKRIEKAKELLAEGKYKVYEVAQLVGYNDVDYFGKKFRKHAGMTPAEFRKQGGTTMTKS